MVTYYGKKKYLIHIKGSTFFVTLKFIHFDLYEET